MLAEIIMAIVIVSIVIVEISIITINYKMPKIKKVVREIKRRNEKIEEISQAEFDEMSEKNWL